MKIYDCEQQTPDWFSVRLGKCTSSCFGKAIGGGQGKTRKAYMIQLIAERMTESPHEGYTNAVMQRGSEIEPLAREYYELLNDVSVRRVGFVERDEWIGASPDGLVGEEGMLEIKSPNSTTHIEYILGDRFPPTYKPQVQGQLWVAERQWCDFVSYDPRVSQRPYFCVRVYRDDAFIRELHTKIVMFINDMKEMLDRLTKPAF